MQERKFIYQSDSRSNIINQFTGYFFKFCELLGLFTVILAGIDIYRVGFLHINPWAIAVSMVCGSLGMLFLCFNFSYHANLRARAMDLVNKELEIRDKAGIQDINEKNLKLYEREIALKKMGKSSGIYTSKLSDDFEYGQDADGAWRTTEARTIKEEINPEMVYSFLKTQAQKEKKGMEWWSDEEWKKYQRKPYRKLTANGREEGLKFLSFEHIKWRKNNPTMNPSHSPITVDLTHA